MRDLDPALIETVAKMLCDQYGDEWDDLEPDIQGYLRRDAERLIRAVDTFRAAAVRDAVIELSDATCEAGRKVGCDLISVWKRYADARDALLALVGAQETE